MNRNHNDNPGGKKKKKSNYKLKRSFTRNKKLRQDEPEKSGGGYKKDFRKSSEGEERPKKYSGGRFDKDKRESNKEKRSERKELFVQKNKREFTDRKFGKDRSFPKERPFSKDKPYDKERFSSKEKSYDKEHSFSKEKSYDKPRDKKEFKDKPYAKDRGFSKEKNYDRSGDKKEFKKEYGEKKHGNGFYNKKNADKPAKKTFAEQGLIRLNRYIANAGICSRREADDLIATGCITVNGKVITELGYKVKATDEVNYSGQRLKTEKHRYVLLNKPKDYITTADDDRGRRTVMELVSGACKERIYPVGRLDRNTTGLLLFTNDGEMTKKLTHPKHRVQKLYHVELDKNLKHDDLLKIQAGVELEDGFIKPDEVSYAGESKREVGILIHSGRNRIVRRIFEGLGYDVLRLDRIMFAGLTKKDLPRGHWRHLTEKEIAFLKMV
jgi:23S rRNA pseudouridine2605 synthase